MAVSIRHPLPTRGDVRAATEDDLRRELGRLQGVEPRRIFLTGGATEANTAVLFYVRSRDPSGSLRCRVRYPEYPSLFHTAHAAGFSVDDSPRPATIALLSQPRNPEGTLDGHAELDRWATGARHLLVDETFREFSGRPSLAGRRPRTWVTSSFTKFYGGDDLRVGYVVAPDEERDRFAAFHGLLYDEIAPYSVAGALRCLRSLPRIRAEVRQILATNLDALRSGLPDARSPVAPLFFDRVPGVDGMRVARRCLAASVLVCPGSFFGDPTGVRICLTRRTFPRDFEAYLEVRGRLRAERARATTASPQRARRRRAGTGRARAGPG